MRLLRIAIVSVATVYMLYSCDMPDYKRAAARIDSLLSERYLDDEPGAAILVADGDRVIIDKGYGLADLSSAEKIDGKTMFNIASLSKQFTSVGILRLQEMGKLSVDDSVAKFFPEFPSPRWREIQLRHLLSHSSGVPDARNHSHEESLSVTDAESIEYMTDLKDFKFSPGTQYDYINPTFDLLGIIIGKASGMDFENFQKEQVFAPSGMKDILYFSPALTIKNMAHGYVSRDSAKRSGSDSDSEKSNDGLHYGFHDSEGKEWAEFDYGEETYFATKADGGIYTCTRELLQWENALRNNLCISELSLSEAYSKHTKVSGSKFCNYQNRPYTWYGYGWFADETPGRPLKVYHTGDNGGFQSYIAKFPGTDVNVIMLENRNDFDRWSTQTAIENILIEEGIL